MKFDQLITSLQELDGSLKNQAAQSANVGLTLRNWFVGAYIVEFEQNGEDRAEYGENMISAIAKKLKISGLPPTTLRLCRTLYQDYPEIQQIPSVKSLNSLINNDSRIRQTLSVELTSFFSTIPQTLSGELEGGLSDSAQKIQTVSDLSKRPDFATPVDELLKRLTFSHLSLIHI